MTHNQPCYLLDTTVLSNFAHVRRADLPRTVLGANVAVTPAILAELRAGEQAGREPACDWTWLTVLTPTASELATADTLERQLGPGEAECLAVAFERGYRFLSDDFAARRVAEIKGLIVSGTIGILLRGVATGVLIGARGGSPAGRDDRPRLSSASAIAARASNRLKGR